MTVKELDTEYKQKWAELYLILGRDPNIKDKEYWELTDWHRNACESFKSVEVKEKAPREDITEVKQPRVSNKCKICSREILPTGRRGRPAVKCDKCKAEGK